MIGDYIEWVCCLSREVHCGARSENGLCMLHVMVSDYPICDYMIESGD